MPAGSESAFFFGTAIGTVLGLGIAALLLAMLSGRRVTRFDRPSMPRPPRR